MKYAAVTIGKKMRKARELNSMDLCVYAADAGSPANRRPSESDNTPIAVRQGPFRRPQAAFRLDRLSVIGRIEIKRPCRGRAVTRSAIKSTNPRCHMMIERDARIS